MPKKSGKDRGSLTQSADNQQVRISQVSNVSKAVNAMGKETTRRMQETDRRVAEGGDVKEIAGSMNSVLDSLKMTVDSLNKGVEAATFGTAKAAQEAISQYGQAISEDFKINRQNMVASALATSTPIFGYFASKFFETGVFKKAKDKMSESVSGIFKRKSKGGSMPDDFGDEMDGGAGPRLTPAQAAAKARERQATQKKDNLYAMKMANRDKYENYDKSTEEKTLIALTAIQGAIGAQIGKFSQWYDKFLLQHPYFRTTMTIFKGMSATFGGVWKAAYFFWRPRGGYRKHLSRSKNPFEAINQNLGALFVQTMPRLDAIMIYTKATAIAVRDLSSHVTGKKYPMMDPSKQGGTWSIAGVTMSILRGAGRLMMKGARALNKSMFLEGSRGREIFEGAIEGTETLGKIADYTLTGPGRAKDWAMKKTLGQLPGAKDWRRLTGGLEESDMPGEGFGMRGQKDECIAVKICNQQKRLPKNQKGMGKRHTPDLIVQNVYDEWYATREKNKDKYDKKLLGYTAESAKYLDQHDKREKRRTTMGIFGGIFSGIGKIFSGLMGFLGPIIGMAKGGISSFIKSLFLKGGAISAGVKGLMAAGGPIATALASKAFWGPIGAAFAGWGLGTWINKNWIKPWVEQWMDKQDKKQQEGLKDSSNIIDQLSKEAKKGDYTARAALSATSGIKQQKTWLGTSINSAAVRAGQLKVIQKNKGIYAKYDLDEINKQRTRWQHSLGYYTWYARMSQGEDPEKFGEKKETAFLKYLQKVGTPMSQEEYGTTAKEYHQAQVDAGGGTVIDKSKKLAIAAKEKAEEAAKKAKDVALVTWEQANDLAAKYGGHAREYVNKKFPEAEAHGKKLMEKATQAKEYIKTKASEIKTVGVKEAKELSDKYGGKPEEYLNLTIDKAKKLGEYIKKHGGEFGGGGAQGAWTASKEQMERVKEESKSMFGKFWAWVTGTRPIDRVDQIAAQALESRALQKTGEFIDLGKGNFVELYRQGTGAVREMWETATPEKKAWIRQNAERLLASGQITAEELKKMGIKLKDATVEGAQKVGEAVVNSAVHTSNQISNAVTNTTYQTGGGFGGNFMNEKTMDDIARGNIEN